MNIFTGFVAFQVIWWTVFMAVLPMGVQVDENPEKGFATSAPIKPDIRKKVILTTKISAILWVIAFVVIHFNLIDIF